MLMQAIYMVNVMRHFIDCMYVIDPRTLGHASIRSKQFAKSANVSRLHDSTVYRFQKRVSKRASGIRRIKVPAA
jgi:hypothetical protein